MKQQRLSTLTALGVLALPACTAISSKINEMSLSARYEETCVERYGKGHSTDQAEAFCECARKEFDKTERSAAVLKQGLDSPDFYVMEFQSWADSTAGAAVTQKCWR